MEIIELPMHSHDEEKLIQSPPDTYSKHHPHNPLSSPIDSYTHYFTYFPKRFQFVLFCFFGIAINYSDRTNISVAIMDMAKEFNWSNADKGFAMSSFYIGYFISGIGGGYMADVYGGKMVLFYASIAWSLFTLVTPAFSRVSFGLLIFIRILLGIAEGLAFPCVHSMMSLWMPKQEISRAVSFATSGYALGTVISVLLSPPLIAYFSWPSAFYLFGAVGLVWSFCWLKFASDTPGTHLSINESELNFIASNLSIRNKSFGSIPWKVIFTSKSLWAFYLNMFASGWSFFVLLSWMPDYFNEELHVSLEEVGYYSVVPYVCQGFVGPMSGVLSDYLLKLYRFDPVYLCTIFQMLAMIGPILFLSLLGFTSVSPVAATAYLTLALSTNAFTSAGVTIYHLIVIPEFAGVVFAIGNSLSVFPAIVGI